MKQQEKKKRSDLIKVGVNSNYIVDEIEIPVSDFIISALSDDSRIDIMWTRSVSPSTRVRAYTISIVDNFKDRISRSFLPWYKDGKGPNDMDAENYTVQEKTPTLTDKELEDFDSRLSSGVLVTIAYQTGINARLIVDGCKRSCALQNRINHGLKFPSLQVIECYGPEVANSFPIDFSHIIRKLDRK